MLMGNGVIKLIGIFNQDLSSYLKILKQDLIKRFWLCKTLEKKPKLK